MTNCARRAASPRHEILLDTFLIAGYGLARGLILVTSNTGEFDRVGGLLLENWR